MDLREVQLLQLEIFNEVEKLIKKNDLRYFALGGTVLGAVRHKGFIPWDDDIDIGMPRKDYESFCKICDKDLPKNLKLRNYKNDKNYRYYISRILNSDYKIVETRNKDVEAYTYISIDIFPLDGFPNNTLLRKIHTLRILFRRMKMSLGYFDTFDKGRQRSFIERLLIAFFSKIPVQSFIDSNKEKEKIDKLLKKYSFDDCNYVGNIMGAYRQKEIFCKRIFDNAKMLEFENSEIAIPRLYHDYLQKMYGDYMKIPNSEEIERKKHFESVK